jgi:hypothetical protein
MKRWSLTFKINDDRCNAPKVWFDYADDFLIFLGYNTFTIGSLDFLESANLVHFDDRARVRNIAVNMVDVLVPEEDDGDVDDWEIDAGCFDGVETAKQIHAIYPNLRSLYIILNHAPETKEYQFTKPIGDLDCEGYGPLRTDLNDTWLSEDWGTLDVQYVHIEKATKT